MLCLRCERQKVGVGWPLRCGSVQRSMFMGTVLELPSRMPFHNVTHTAHVNRAPKHVSKSGISLDPPWCRANDEGRWQIVPEVHESLIVSFRGFYCRKRQSVLAVVFVFNTGLFALTLSISPKRRKVTHKLPLYPR